MIYGSKIAKMTGCHIEQKKQPGNWIMNQNTHQAMGKDVLGTFTPHPGGIPGPGPQHKMYIAVQGHSRQVFPIFCDLWWHVHFVQCALVCT